MDLGKRYFGKVYMREALIAITSPENMDICIDLDTGYIMPQPLSELLPEDIDFTQEDCDFTKEELEKAIEEENEIYGYDKMRKINLPLDDDLGIEEHILQFAKQHKIKLPKYNTSAWEKNALTLFETELRRRNLKDEWEEEFMDTIYDGLAKWFDDNGIAYIDDSAYDYEKSLEDCTYVFSVSLKKGCYRHIKISSSDCLGDLAFEIVDAFDFDNDHAHAFFMGNEFWDARTEFASMDVSHTPRTSEMSYLADFHFDEGDAFKFIFDFGDEWRFNVKFLRRIDEPCKMAGVIRRVGVSPEQYPDWDEEDWDEQ